MYLIVRRKTNYNLAISQNYLLECNSRKISNCARDVLSSTLRNNLKFDKEVHQANNSEPKW